MRLLSKIKITVCNYSIIKEWLENGEFTQADKIMIIGTKQQAVMVKYLFRGTTKKIYHCAKFERRCAYKGRAKWIIFDSGIKMAIPQKNYNILLVPNV